jgi:N-acetylmuramoyl-L-alanine amidase
MSDHLPALFRLGDEGDGVLAIRERLQRTGDLPAGEAVGTAGHASPQGSSRQAPVESVPNDPLRYDDKLHRAVRAFQQRRGLIADGIVGPQTYVELDGARWTLGDRLLSHTPGHLLQGDDVATLQERLLALGFSPERVDGLFGPNTEQAVRGFQRGVGLAPDGLVGPATLRAFADLSRSVTGGSPHTLRERELVRRSGHSLAGRTIVLDPGHGGDAPGALAHDLREADLMLDLARRIEGRLSAIGVTVLFTRASSTDPDDLARADLANEAGADILLSLHCDSTDQPQAAGVATFFFGQDRFGAWSAVGEHLADLVQREIVARTGLADCRSHARAWTLLRHTRMPAVRIEAGYLSHPDDAAMLARPQFRDTLAEAVVVALQRMYLGEDDTNATGVLNLGDLRAYLESRTA